MAVPRGKLVLKNKSSATIKKKEKPEKIESKGTQDAPITVQYKDTRTKAEIAFEKHALEREELLIGKKISKTHRQKIQEFNQKLATEPEHYDIPRVGPG